LIVASNQVDRPNSARGNRPCPVPIQSRQLRPSRAPPPDRWNRGAWLFRDRTLHGLEILLDEAFVLPGTGIRFGLDGIIGLVPGLGDVLAGLLSLVIPLAAWIRGVPYVTLARMAANLGIGVLVGSIPLFGDIFDIAWKANRRNYRLLCRHLGEPRRTPAGLGVSAAAGRGRGAGLRHPRGAGGVVPGLAPQLAETRSLNAPNGKPIRDTIEEERRGVAQPGSASALGAEGRGFESLRPDQNKALIMQAILPGAGCWVPHPSPFFWRRVGDHEPQSISLIRSESSEGESGFPRTGPLVAENISPSAHHSK
jgi:hypothetical protein